MGKVAVVTGGSRGIGAAISKALKGAGYTVAANYGGNDEAANKFKAETGIAVRVIDGNGTLLKNCASKPSMYYDVDQAIELTSVFGAIAQNLANLRITR